MLNWNHRANMDGKKYPPGRTSIPLAQPKIEKLEKQFLKVKIWHTDGKDYSKGNISHTFQGFQLGRERMKHHFA